MDISDEIVLIRADRADDDEAFDARGVSMATLGALHSLLSLTRPTHE